MKKNVYSLVLMEEVVNEIDRLAYAMNTSRSNMINQILADYVSYVTPEQRMREVFEAAEALIRQAGELQILMQPSDAMLSMRSAISYKYNPTIRYSVELYREEGRDVGVLKAALRTQNRNLLAAADGFFHLWAQMEGHLLGQAPPTEIEPGKLTRTLAVAGGAERSSSQLGQAIAAYVQLFDSCLKLYFDQMDCPEEMSRQMIARYQSYLSNKPIIR